MNKQDVISHALSFKFGGMLPEELSFLYDICVGKSVLELGSMVGMSSYVIASVAKELSCVDVWSDSQEHLSHDPVQANIYKVYLPELPNMFEQFKINCKEFIDSKKIKMYRGKTQNLFNQFPDNYFDLLLIDADHSYQGVFTDFNLYHTKIHKDGRIAFHDYGDSMWIQIAIFCNEMVRQNKIRPIAYCERIAIFGKI
jgi:hypothetical protein